MLVAAPALTLGARPAGAAKAPKPWVGGAPASRAAGDGFDVLFPDQWTQLDVDAVVNRNAGPTGAKPPPFWSYLAREKSGPLVGAEVQLLASPGKPGGPGGRSVFPDPTKRVSLSVGRVGLGTKARSLREWVEANGGEQAVGAAIARASQDAAMAAESERDFPDPPPLLLSELSSDGDALNVAFEVLTVGNAQVAPRYTDCRTLLLAKDGTSVLVSRVTYAQWYEPAWREGAEALARSVRAT